MRWRGARRIGDCSGRCISKFRFSRLLPPDTPRRAVCPGREAPVPGCRVSLLVLMGGLGFAGVKREKSNSSPNPPGPAERRFLNSSIWGYKKLSYPILIFFIEYKFQGFDSFLYGYFTLPPNGTPQSVPARLPSRSARSGGTCRRPSGTGWRTRSPWAY